MRIAPMLITCLACAATAAAGERSEAELRRLIDAHQRTGGDAAAASQIDRMAGQVNAMRSRLFWHTNLGEAMAVARHANKPILSLRLLGRLDEEMSCANSRFFRKTLYVDPTIAAALRERYVLHWESLRPVPIVTVDYGEGRTVKRTLTGNSIHYLLSPAGEVVDAIPGLVDAETFAREVKSFADWVAACPSPTAEQAKAYRAAKLNALASVPRTAQPAAPRKADTAARRAMAKSVLQVPLLRATRNPSRAVRRTR